MDQLASVWDNVVSLVNEGIDFELLPMTTQSASLLNNDSKDHEVSKRPPHLSTDDSDGHTAEHGAEPLTPCDQHDSGKLEDGGTSLSPEETGPKPSPPSPSAAGGPPPPPPPPGPPPPPMVAKADPFTEAKQEITRLIMRIKGVSGFKGEAMKKKEKNSGNVCLDYDGLDAKGRQWADFNARGHKLKDGRAFIDLANQNRKEIDQQLKNLKSKSDEEVFTLKELKSAVDVLDTAGDWYQGGVNKLKEGSLLYKELEKLIEVMEEFLTLRGEMTDLPRQYQCDSDPQEVLNKTMLEFEKEHARLGEVILSGAEVWRKHRFPVCDKLLWKCQGYLCGMVVKFVETSLNRASKVDTSKTNHETLLAKQDFEESIQLLQTAAPYFSLKQPLLEEGICSCEICSDGAKSSTIQQNGRQQTFVQEDLLRLTVKVAETYFQFSTDQFEGYIHKMGEQKVCDQFQSTLGFLKKVEDLVNGLPKDKVKSSNQLKPAAAGVIGRLPESDSLKKAMSRSCQSLCEHIKNEALIYRDLPSQKDSEIKRKKTKDMVHWMSFYCKYSHHILTASGSPPANHEKTTLDTVQIAFSFIEDNLKQYNEFVHVLDERRVRAHFECIMRVVISLVSILPTNGDSSSGKFLKSLPNSELLITAVIQSCDRLVEHYQSRKQSIVKLLEATDAEPSVLKKQKEEVTQWLAFGGEYLREMLNALGPDHTTTVMRKFSEFEKVTINIEYNYFEVHNGIET